MRFSDTVLIMDLKTLRDATELAINDARSVSEDFADPINWEDLRCVRVLHWVDDNMDSGFTVEIEEASPDAAEFCRWIRENIKERTGLDVEIITDW